MTLTACGSAPAHTATVVSPTHGSSAAYASPTVVASSSRTPTSTPPPQQPIVSPTLLFAVLEAKGASNPTQWNTVAIAGVNGYAKAKTTFTPMPVPYVGCAGPVLPASAHVAAGKVYYADSTGVIRSLASDGKLATVTTLPLTSTQQMLSFAVSPDGSQLIGTIFTLPPKASSTSDPCATGGSPFGPGDFRLDVYSAQTGGSAHLLYHQDLGTFGNPTSQVLAFIGWDAKGPVGTYPTSWATQGGGPHHYNGVPVRVDATTGKVTAPVSTDQACSVWDMAPSGDYVCDASNGISVRRADGTELWHYTPPDSNTSWFLDFLSPDESRVVSAGIGVVNRDGTVIPLPDAFSYQASLDSSTVWLDSMTLIGGGMTENLNYVSLTAPGTIVDLGFKGVLVGTVRS